VDLLERKLHLLEQKGWFEGMDHQREALDRLLPTIRAAADPLTRDLYLKEVAERTGVSRETLVHQLADRQEPLLGSPPDGGSSGIRAGSKVSHSTSTGRPEHGERTASPRKVDSAERDLLRVVLKDAEWARRAVEQVAPEWFETPVFRELFEALCSSPEMSGVPISLEALSPAAQDAYAELINTDPKYGRPDPDRTFDGAIATLKTRVLKQELRELDKRMKRISPDEYDALIQRRKLLLSQIAAHNPEELVKRQHRGGNRDAR
jgi:DNA primase